MKNLLIVLSLVTSSSVFANSIVPDYYDANGNAIWNSLIMQSGDVYSMPIRYNFADCYGDPYACHSVASDTWIELKMGGGNTHTNDEASLSVTPNNITDQNLTIEWWYNGDGKHAQDLVFQADGNLVKYDHGYRDHAHSNWSASAEAGYHVPQYGARLVLQKDGNLMVLDSSNNVLWSTGEACPDKDRSHSGGCFLSDVPPWSPTATTTLIPTMPTMPNSSIPAKQLTQQVQMPW